MNDPDHPEHKRLRRPGIIAKLRSNFLAGVIIVAPIGMTLWLIWTVVGWVDSWVWPFVPNAYHPEQLVNHFLGRTPENWITVNVRGVGVVIFLIFTVIVGWIGKGIIGRSFLSIGERIVDRMPVVRSVYNAVKQIAETVFSQRDTSFDKACLVEYPRKGIWAIAFVSTNAKGEIDEKLADGETFTTVFLPTTPNPTSGFLLFLPLRDVKMLDMSVEDAAKLVISAGLVYPNDKTVTSIPHAAE
ncbi:DUF502 domain-containing protein [Yoonia sediminilitoris]|uniref:Putative membrane protein n=1 Tax=Yoonia sediminilitoris TaxID=1286148 RepID=A0A2T6KCY9_9RHOB|nr:DUF502 domain-containing protein [Yoonia sediminilitoris]PUB12823.1 putative membrane protein [Yoonia sediminilitoris]RCW94302.1 putative membrane protein [Yoonia sediminilitoris]